MPKRPDGRFPIKLTYKDKDGVKQHTTFYGRGETTKLAKRAAEAKRDAFLAQIGQGMNPSAAKGMTVGQFLQQWLDLVVVGRLATNTVETYSRAVVNLQGLIGHILLTELRAMEIDTMLKTLRDKPSPSWIRKNPDGSTTEVPGKIRSPKYQRQIFDVLRLALDKALTKGWGLIPFNPADGCTAPSGTSPKMKFYDREQAQAFLAEAKNRGPFVEALARVSLWGLRISEVQGLRWCDVDFAVGSLRIVHQATAENLPCRCCRTLDLKPPKTDAGCRTVPLDPATVRALVLHRENLMRLGRPVIGLSWVFPVVKQRGIEVERYIGEENIRGRFNGIQAAAGLPHIRVHDLRHTAISIMLANGVEPIEVMRIVGHSKMSQLDEYKHFIPSKGESPAVAAMAGLWA